MTSSLRSEVAVLGITQRRPQTRSRKLKRGTQFLIGVIGSGYLTKPVEVGLQRPTLLDPNVDRLAKVTTDSFV